MINAIQPVDTREMVVVHRVFRRELGMLPDLILGVSDGDRVRAAIVAEHLSDMIHALHHHHTAEDILLWPVLLRRIGDNPLLPRMQRQHDQLAVLLDRVATLTPHWRDTADADKARELADTVGQVSAALAEHLHDEERGILPLVARHVTHAEWQALGEYGRRVIPKKHQGLRVRRPGSRGGRRGRTERLPQPAAHADPLGLAAGGRPRVPQSDDQDPRR